MIGIQHVHHLIAYFEGVDAALSRTFLRPVPPDEPALTNQLCALMDAETQRREQSLSFNIDQLNEALALCGDDVKFEFRIDTHHHSTKMENLVSQSDFGLVLEYKNYILPDEDRIWSYLIQAKRLHHNLPSGEFSERSVFKGFNLNQHNFLKKLSKKFGPHFFKYMMYCPPISHFTPPTATKIRAIHTRNLSHPIYDYSGGLALFEHVKSVSGRVESGIWLTPIESVPASVMELHKVAFVDAWSWSWFLLRHLTQPHSGGQQRLHHDENFKMNGTELISGGDALIYGVVTGDRDAIEEFCKVAYKMDLDTLPKLKVLPGSTITITATVGHSLPDDHRRAFIQD
jgi:hypothetical protein